MYFLLKLFFVKLYLGKIKICVFNNILFNNNKKMATFLVDFTSPQIMQFTIFL